MNAVQTPITGGSPKLDHEDTMTWQGAVEHESLYVTAGLLIKQLKGLPTGLQHGSAQHMIHTDAAERCRSLGLTIESAVACAERDAYGPAFALLRSALEQTLVDKLVFLGRRHIQVVRGVPADVWQTWQEEKESGSKWTDVIDWRRTHTGAVRIVREGIFSESNEDGSRQTIGIHYFLLRDYSPFVGPPDVYGRLDDGLSEPEDRHAYAEQQRSMYDIYLKWPSLRENVKANGFADEVALSKLDCHYRFLSAFVHPISDVTRLLYGRHGSWNAPFYDHYSSELVLLYSVVMAVDEIRNFGEMARQEPTVEVEDWHRTETLCDLAWALSGYLWYPGQQPHDHDRYEEANRRAFRGLRATQERMPPPDPATLPADEISYYANPLQRLVALHASKQEMITGLVYISPWHRRDAEIGR
jgi:hypothetical protein